MVRQSTQKLPNQMVAGIVSWWSTWLDAMRSPYQADAGQTHLKLS
jgi:hypothetical protein